MPVFNFHEHPNEYTLENCRDIGCEKAMLLPVGAREPIPRETSRKSTLACLYRSTGSTSTRPWSASWKSCATRR